MSQGGYSLELLSVVGREAAAVLAACLVLEKCGEDIEQLVFGAVRTSECSPEA